MQEANTHDMLFPVAELIHYISQYMTLEPGDVLATGTPAGIGAFRTPPVWLKRGDTIRVEVSGMGTLVEDDIPLNAGCLKPIEVRIPQGSMLDPQPPASVVAGNVETSTCITNALCAALGLVASSQPTVNNFTFGNARYQYYETISGGSGAGPVLDAQGQVVGGFAGTSVVQTHMTNSRMTDPEVLEFRFPVRLLSYSIRQGSGGAGRWPGGHGGIRRIQFLEPMTASILSNGRIHAGYGLEGGQAGAVGINRVIRADGEVQNLGHIGSVEMLPGDVFEICTPGGGGYGAV